MTSFQRALTATAALTLPKAIIIGLAIMFFLALHQVLTGPDSWDFIVTFMAITFLPTLIVAFVVWLVLATLRAIFLTDQGK